MLDSASSNASDPLSLQPNRAVVAILTTLSEAIPFAHYLPADIQSNEAKLAIMTHQAGKDYGRYTQGALMDGAFSGDTYISSSREHKCEIVLDAGNPTGAITGKLTSIQTDGDTCNPAAPEVKLLRGRSLVYVNGLIAAREVSGTGTGPSVVSGQTNIAGTVHQISGTVHPDTGVIALVSTPPMAATNSVVVEGFIDYERALGFGSGLGLGLFLGFVIGDAALDDRLQRLVIFQNKLLSVAEQEGVVGGQGAQAV